MFPSKFIGDWGISDNDFFNDERASRQAYERELYERQAEELRRRALEEKLRQLAPPQDSEEILRQLNLYKHAGTSTEPKPQAPPVDEFEEAIKKAAELFKL